jgi:hypothetical protein
MGAKILLHLLEMLVAEHLLLFELLFTESLCLEILLAICFRDFLVDELIFSESTLGTSASVPFPERIFDWEVIVVERKGESKLGFLIFIFRHLVLTV